MGLRILTIGSATPVRRSSAPIPHGIHPDNSRGPRRGVEDRAVTQLSKMADSLTFDYAAFALAMDRMPHKIQVRIAQMIWAWFEHLSIKADMNLWTGDEEYDNLMRDSQQMNRLANP